MTDSTIWVTIGSGISILLSLVLYTALLVVALVWVRKRDATAAWLMSGAAGTMALAALASPLAYAGMARAVGATEDYLMLHGVVGIAFSLVRAAGWALLLVGIAKLARGGPDAPRIP